MLPGKRRGAVVDVEQAVSRLDAGRLRLVAEADQRALSAPTPAREGVRDRRPARQRRAEALVHLADSGRPGPAVPAARAWMPGTSAASSPSALAPRSVFAHPVAHDPEPTCGCVPGSCASGGATSEDDGALLCKRHHLTVHARGWRGHVVGTAVVWDPPERGSPHTPPAPWAPVMDRSVERWRAVSGRGTPAGRCSAPRRG